MKNSNPKKDILKKSSLFHNFSVCLKFKPHRNVLFLKASCHLKFCQSNARLSTELATGAQESTELKASKASSKKATETKPKCA